MPISIDIDGMQVIESQVQKEAWIVAEDDVVDYLVRHSFRAITNANLRRGVNYRFLVSQAKFFEMEEFVEKQVATLEKCPPGSPAPGTLTVHPMADESLKLVLPGCLFAPADFKHSSSFGLSRRDIRNVAPSAARRISPTSKMPSVSSLEQSSSVSPSTSSAHGSKSERSARKTIILHEISSRPRRPIRPAIFGQLCASTQDLSGRWVAYSSLCLCLCFFMAEIRSLLEASVPSVSPYRHQDDALLMNARSCRSMRNSAPNPDHLEFLFPEGIARAHTGFVVESQQPEFRNFLDHEIRKAFRVLSAAAT